MPNTIGSPPAILKCTDRDIGCNFLLVCIGYRNKWIGVLIPAEGWLRFQYELFVGTYQKLQADGVYI